MITLVVNGERRRVTEYGNPDIHARIQNGDWQAAAVRLARRLLNEPRAEAWNWHLGGWRADGEMQEHLTTLVGPRGKDGGWPVIGEIKVNLWRAREA